MPRINGGLLGSHLGRQVILMCEFLTPLTDGRSVRAKASDGQDVTVVLPIGERIEEKYFQVIGKVSHNNTIEGMKIIPSGMDFNMENYDKVVMMGHQRFPHLFL